MRIREYYISNIMEWQPKFWPEIYDVRKTSDTPKESKKNI